MGIRFAVCDIDCDGLEWEHFQLHDFREIRVAQDICLPIGLVRKSEVSVQQAFAIPLSLNYAVT